MTILGATILPHQPVLLDPFREEAPEGVSAISRCCDIAADIVAKWEPETVVIVTPHGISASRSPRPGVYLTSTGSGSAADGEFYQDYSVKVDFNVSLARGFLDHLGDAGIACIKVTGNEAPLSKDEVVPLWFLRNLPNTKNSPKFVILSVPNKGTGDSSLARSESSKENIENTIDYGRHLYQYFSKIRSKVAMVFVGDLAHTHATLCSNPLYLPDESKRLKSCDAAAVFDAMIEKWAYTLRDDVLCSDAAHLVSKAVSCGYDSFVALHSMMKKDGISKYSRHVLSRHRPTTIGMIVTVFQVDKRVPNPGYAYEFQ